MLFGVCVTFLEFARYNKSMKHSEISNSCIPQKKKYLHIEHPYHGYGLQNVREVIKKYQGNLTIEEKNNRFYLSAYLNLLPD